MTSETTTSQTQRELPEIPGEPSDCANDDSFSFGCHPGLACFNQCCARRHHRAHALRHPPACPRACGMHLARIPREAHRSRRITKEPTCPVVLLKMQGRARAAVPLRGGRRVHRLRRPALGLPHVPRRRWPVGPAQAADRAAPVYFLLRGRLLRGLDEARQWTADRSGRSGSGHRGATTRSRSGFKELVAPPGLHRGAAARPASRMDMFYMACYDLDRFRASSSRSSFLKTFEVRAGSRSRRMRAATTSRCSASPLRDGHVDDPQLRSPEARRE